MSGLWNWRRARAGGFCVEQRVVLSVEKQSDDVVFLSCERGSSASPLGRLGRASVMGWADGLLSTRTKVLGNMAHRGGGGTLREVDQGTFGGQQKASNWAAKNTCESTCHVAPEPAGDSSFLRCSIMRYLPTDLGSSVQRQLQGGWSTVSEAKPAPCTVCDKYIRYLDGQTGVSGTDGKYYADTPYVQVCSVAYYEVKGSWAPTVHQKKKKKKKYARQCRVEYPKHASNLELNPVMHQPLHMAESSREEDRQQKPLTNEHVVAGFENLILVFWLRRQARLIGPQAATYALCGALFKVSTRLSRRQGAPPNHQWR